jgi:hypothetical protein
MSHTSSLCNHIYLPIVCYLICYLRLLVHFCNHFPPTTAVALSLPKPIAGCVFWMACSVLTPVIGVLFAPLRLGRTLVGTVVGISCHCGLLPTPFAERLALSVFAISLARNVWPHRELLSTPGTIPLYHGFSLQKQTQDENHFSRGVKTGIGTKWRWLSGKNWRKH